MNKVTVTLFIGVLVCWGGFFAAPAAAQDNEIFFFAGPGVSLNDTPYQNRFLAYGYMPSDWSGEQSIRFDIKPKMGFGMGFTHWFSAHWGVQILGHRHKTKMEGLSDPVHIAYTYYAWAPSQPFPEVNVDYTFTPTREPSGEYNQLSLGLNAVCRFSLSPVTVSLSGGIAYYRLSGGEIRALYFENGIMVSRGAIFKTSGLTTVKMSARSRIGANLGLRVQVPLVPSFHMFLEGRYFYCPPTDLNLHLTAVDKIESFWHAENLADIAPLMERQPIRLKPSFISLNIGMAFLF